MLVKSERLKLFLNHRQQRQPSSVYAASTMSSDNPRGRRAIDVSAAFTGIAVVLVALRLYTRFFLIRCPGAEDYMITVAMVSRPLSNLAQ